MSDVSDYDYHHVDSMDHNEVFELLYQCTFVMTMIMMMTLTRWSCYPILIPMHICCDHDNDDNDIVIPVYTV